MAPEKKPKYFDEYSTFVNADGYDKWKPEKYERLALYVSLYNFVKENLQDFVPQEVAGKGMQPSKYLDPDTGLYKDFKLNTASALSTQANDIIKNNLDWFFKYFKINDDEDHKGYSMAIDPATFEAEFPSYIAEANKIASKVPRVNGAKGPLTAQEVKLLLSAKEAKTRAWFDHVRNSVEGKPLDVDEEGKPVGGARVIAVTKVEQKRVELLHQIALASGNALFKSLLTAGGAGLTIASGLALISSGGTAIGAITGTLFAASPVGMALAGVVGLVVGIKVTKKAFSGMMSAIGKQFGLIKEHYEFIHGIGKNYCPDENGRPRGYRAVKLDYEKAYELKLLMQDFRIPRGTKSIKQFDEAFDKYFEEKLKNSKYWSKADKDFIRQKKSKVRQIFQVSHGGDAKYGASLFGKVRNFISDHNVEERIDYKRATPGELNRLHDGRIENTTDIETLTNYIQELKIDEDAYKAAHSEKDYRQLKQRYTNAILKATNKTAFETPLSSKTVSDLDTVLTNPDLSDFIKTGISEDKTAEIQSIKSFIEVESGIEESISCNNYANVESQLNITKPAMISALSSKTFEEDFAFKAGTSEFDEAEEIIDLIVDYNEVNSAKRTNIESKIQAVSNYFVKNYLDFMWKKKRDSAKLTETSLVGLIRKPEGTWTEQEIIENCKNFGNKSITDESTDGDLRTSLQNIVRQIMDTSTPIDATRYNDLLNSISSELGDRTSVQEYLKYILAVRADKSISGIEDSADYFAKQISSFSDEDAVSEKPLLIRTFIMCSNMTHQAKENAAAKLNSQVSAINNRRRNDSKVTMMEILKNGDFDEFEKHISTITKLVTFEELKDSKILEFYNGTISKISDKRIQTYFREVFKAKAESVIRQHIAEQIKPKISGISGIETLTAFFTEIMQLKFLDPVQKDRLINLLSEDIEKALKPTLKEIYASPISKSGESKTFKSYKDNPYSSKGLKEFLTGTPSSGSRRVGELIDNVTANINKLATYMTGSVGGVAANEDTSDTMVVGRIFFDDLKRDVTDPLLYELKTISSVVKTGDPISQLNNGEKGEAKDATAIIAKLKEEIENAVRNLGGGDLGDFLISVGGIYDFNLSRYDYYFKSNPKKARDLYAALIALKRHIMILYKHHIKQFLTKSVGMGQTGIGSPEIKNAVNKKEADGGKKEAFEEVKNTWRTIAQSIDRLCGKLQPEVEKFNSQIFDETSYIGAENLINNTLDTSVENVAKEISFGLK